MTLKNTFYELAIKSAQKQTALVDAFTEEAPIWASVPMMAASHGMRNVYEKVSNVVGADYVDGDGVLTSMKMDSELASTDLSIFGGIMEIGADKADALGGAAAYFAKQAPIILKESSMAFEKDLFYNKLRAYAIANGKAVSASGSSNTNYSIVAVTWATGEITGLYDQGKFSNGKVFVNEPLAGGYTYKDGGVPTYGMVSKMHTGLQLANPRYVSSIVNIDDDNFVTVAQMNALLHACRAGSNTVLYMSNELQMKMGAALKLEQMQFTNRDKTIDTTVDAWGKTPIISSYNLLDALEANVTL